MHPQCLSLGGYKGEGEASSKHRALASVQTLPVDSCCCVGCWWHGVTGALSPLEPPACQQLSHHASHPRGSHILLSGSAGCSEPLSPSLLPFAGKSHCFGLPPGSLHPQGSCSTVPWLCWKTAPSHRSRAASDPAGPPGAVYLCAGDKASVGHPVPGLDSWSLPRPILSCRGSNLPVLASHSRHQFMGQCSCTSCLWKLHSSPAWEGVGTTGPEAPQGSLCRSPIDQGCTQGCWVAPIPCV